MKRDLKKSTWIGAVVLSLSLTAAGKPVPAPIPAVNHSPGAGQEHPLLKPKDIPQVYGDFADAVKENGNNPARVNLVKLDSEETKNVTPAQLDKQRQYMDSYEELREEIAACPTVEKDPITKRLAGALDEYAKVVHRALIGGTRGVDQKLPAKEAREKDFLVYQHQIVSLLIKRAQLLGGKSPYAPFASESEKKIADNLEQTHSMLFGDETSVSKVDPRSFGTPDDKDPIWVGVGQTHEAFDASASANAKDLCKLEYEADEPQQNAVAQTNKQPDTKVPDSSPDSKQAVSDTVKQMLEQLQAHVEAQAQQGNAAMQKVLDEMKEQMAEAKIQQQKEADAAKQAQISKDKEKDEQYKNMLSAITRQNNDRPNPQQTAQTQPQPQQGGSGSPFGNNGNQNMDPYGQQAMMAQQQQAQMQQQQMAMQQQQMAAMQGGAGMGMGGPAMPAPINAPIYTPTPSRFDNDLGSSISPFAAMATAMTNPVAAGQAAVMQLLSAVRGGMGMNAGGMGPYANGQQYGNMLGQSSGQYGNQFGNGMVGTMANRISAMASTMSRGVGRLGAQMGMGTARGSMVSPTSGPQSLAVSPMGRSTTVPSELMRGVSGRI